MKDFFDRLDMFMKISNLNDNKITVQAGLSIGALGKQRKGSRGLSNDSIAKILCVYQNLNADWLLTGRGEMLKTDKKNDIEEEKIQSQALDTDQIEMIKGMQANMTTLFNTVDRQNKTIDNLTDTISGLTATVAKQNETISNQQRQISELEAKKETTTKSGVARATTLNVGEILK